MGFLAATALQATSYLVRALRADWDKIAHDVSAEIKKEQERSEQIMLAQEEDKNDSYKAQ